MTDVAAREFSAISMEGVRFKLVVRIGTPYATDTDWACPVALEGLDRRTPDMHGVDSLQALVLAVKLARSRLEHFILSGGSLYFLGEEDSPLTVEEVFW